MQEPGQENVGSSSSQQPMQTPTPGGFLPPSYNEPIPSPTSYGSAAPAMGAMMGDNTSGQGAASVVPLEVSQGFNWGAFLLNWIWGIGHSVWIALLALVLGFIPVIGVFAGIGFNIYLGMKGNELAWRNRRFESIEQFKAVQRVWTKWGVGLLIAGIVLGVLMVPVYMRAMQQAQLQRGSQFPSAPSGN